VGAGGTLAVAGGEGALLFWDRRTGGQLAAFEDTHAEAVTQVYRAIFAQVDSAPSRLSAASWHGERQSLLQPVVATCLHHPCRFRVSVSHPRLSPTSFISCHSASFQLPCPAIRPPSGCLTASAFQCRWLSGMRRWRRCSAAPPTGSWRCSTCPAALTRTRPSR